MAGRKTGSPARGRQKSAEPQEPMVAHDASAAGTARRPAESGGDWHRISERAYELYLARGGEHGRDVDDWLEAEREVTNGRDAQPLSSGGTTLSVDDPARGELRRRQYEEGAALVNEID